MIFLLQAECCTVIGYIGPITYIENNLKKT